MFDSQIVHQDEFIVIDDFYKNPQAVRELAQSAEYAKKGELSKNVAGIESLLPYFSYKIVEKFENAIGAKIDVDLAHNAFGRFRLGLEKDTRRTRVHYDNTDWTAVIYLTEAPFCQGGTAFFRHKETGLISPPSAETLKKMGWTKETFDRDLVMKDSLDGSKWEITKICPMKFNRCVLLRGAKYFHGSDQLFGSSFADGRLTQNFFFNEVKP
jgi:hypothetical protein